MTHGFKKQIEAFVFTDKAEEEDDILIWVNAKMPACCYLINPLAEVVVQRMHNLLRRFMAECFKIGHLFHSW